MAKPPSEAAHIDTLVAELTKLVERVANLEKRVEWLERGPHRPPPRSRGPRELN